MARRVQAKEQRDFLLALEQLLGNQLSCVARRRFHVSLRHHEQCAVQPSVADTLRIGSTNSSRTGRCAGNAGFLFVAKSRSQRTRDRESRSNVADMEARGGRRWNDSSVTGYGG